MESCHISLELQCIAFEIVDCMSYLSLTDDLICTPRNEFLKGVQQNEHLQKIEGV